MTPLLALLAATTATPATPPPPPPAVEIHGEVRARGEILDNLDLAPDVKSTGRPLWGDGERILLRTRIGVTGRPGENLTLFGQIQDSRLFGQEPSTVSYVNPTVLHQGWVEVHDLEGVPLALRIGRMELSYGDQRLVGAFNWDNVGRSFDGLLAKTALGDFTVDAFYTRLHVNPWNDFQRSIGDDFAGLYGTWKPSALLQLDAYVFGLFDHGGTVDTDGDGVPDTERLPGGDNLQIYTPGVRVDAKPVDGMHLNGEFAWQLGNRGDLDVSAWALHTGAAYTFAAPLAPKLLAGFDAASGDEDPSDDDWGTFENLFPTNHDKYGLIDLAAWKNLQDIYFGAGISPVETVAVNATVHLLSRLDEGDTFYRANGTPLVDRALALTTDAKNVGTELDITVNWNVTRGFGALLGYSRLFAGDFLDDTAAGGEAPDPTFAYLQLTGAF